MSATRKFALFLFAVCLLAGQAFANTVSLKFVNVGPGNVAPTGYYAYPYNFSINGSSTLTPMMCDAFNNHITFGETWNANVHSILQGGMFGTSGQALLDYKAAGLIFKGVFSGTINAALEEGDADVLPNSSTGQKLAEPAAKSATSPASSARSA